MKLLCGQIPIFVKNRQENKREDFLVYLVSVTLFEEGTEKKQD
jgi:hypothetical protein